MKSNGNTILKNRLKLIFSFIKAQDVIHLEREVAFLVLDVLATIEQETLSYKQADKLFTGISYRVGPEIEKKTSEEFSALLAEAMLLDETGKKFGPDLYELRSLALKILNKDRSLVSYSFNLSARRQV